MLKISAIRIDTHMDTSVSGMSHPFKDAGAVATAMKGIKIPVMKYLFGAKYTGIDKVPYG